MAAQRKPENPAIQAIWVSLEAPQASGTRAMINGKQDAAKQNLKVTYVYGQAAGTRWSLIPEHRKRPRITGSQHLDAAADGC